MNSHLIEERGLQINRKTLRSGPGPLARANSYRQIGYRALRLTMFLCVTPTRITHLPRRSLMRRRVTFHLPISICVHSCLSVVKIPVPARFHFPDFRLPRSQRVAGLFVEMAAPAGRLLASIHAEYRF